jgi:regulator of RNase E activity RraA
MSKPFGLMFEALDDLKPGEIYVASGASPRYALWGELMSTRAKILGAHGALVDGFARDTDGIKALGFPCFCTGYYAQDQGVRGKVIDYRCALEIGGVRIEPGTLLFGDKEGVLVIPRQAEEEVVRLALEKVRGEKLVAKAIREGMSAVDAYKTFGIM